MSKVYERKKCPSWDMGLQTQLRGIKIVCIMGLNQQVPVQKVPVQKPGGSKAQRSKDPWSKAQPLNSKMVKSPSIVIQLDPITIPEGLEPMADYFDATYISGTYRKVQRPPGPDGTVPPIRVRKTPPLFPPDLLNVNIQTMSGRSRTNNLCEACNRGFRSLVRTSHTTIWKALEHIRLDHHNVKTAILLEARGQPPQK